MAQSSSAAEAAPKKNLYVGAEASTHKAGGAGCEIFPATMPVLAGVSRASRLVGLHSEGILEFRCDREAVHFKCDREAVDEVNQHGTNTRR